MVDWYRKRVRSLVFASKSNVWCICWLVWCKSSCLSLIAAMPGLGPKTCQLNAFRTYPSLTCANYIQLPCDTGSTGLAVRWASDTFQFQHLCFQTGWTDQLYCMFTSTSCKPSASLPLWPIDRVWVGRLRKEKANNIYIYNIYNYYNCNNNNYYYYYDILKIINMFLHWFLGTNPHLRSSEQQTYRWRKRWSNVLQGRPQAMRLSVSLYHAFLGGTSS